MFALSSEALAALQARHAQLIWAVWITARNRDSGDPEPAGFWMGARAATIEVISGETLIAVERAFKADGALLEVSGITGTGDLSAKTATIRLAQGDADVEQLVRGHDVRQAPVETYLGIFDPAAQTLVDTPRPKFMGHVDRAEIVTPAENDFGAVSLHCIANRDLNRASTELRSHQSQILRNEVDTFMKFVGPMGKKSHYWGKFGGPINLPSGPTLPTGPSI